MYNFKRNHFWYSQQQADYMANADTLKLREGVNRRNYALIDGKTVLYTTMNNTDINSCLYYKDSIYLGSGIYSHHDGVW